MATDPAGSGALVLIVDDDPGVRAVFTRALKGAGLEVLSASSGEEALAILGQTRVNLVVLDEVMPGISGLEVLAAIRRDPDTRTLPVILVTGRGALDDRVAGLGAGADDFLSKPAPLSELVARVRAHLRNRAEWTDALHEEVEERRAIIAALRQTPGGSGPEQASLDLLERVAPALRASGTAILGEVGGGYWSLAATGTLAMAYPAGQGIARDTARMLRERAADGAWVSERRQAQIGEETATAFLPLRTGDSTWGFLVVALAGNADDAARHRADRRMALLRETADMVAVALRDSVGDLQWISGQREEIQRICDERAFRIHLQPIIDLQQGSVLGYEALTRFDDGESPATRFGQASSLGVGVLLETATLEESLHVGRTLRRGQLLFANISGSFLADDAIERVLRGTTRTTVLEISEHEPLVDYEAVKRRLDALKPRCQLAVDDAGSGYASLRHVLLLHPDYVKLDREWVTGIDTQPDKQALVRAILSLATHAGWRVIAEGIETDDELVTLRELGCHFGQGYVLGMPAAP